MIRGFKLDSPFAPLEGYRYDGLYIVERAWMAPGLTKGLKVCKYAFKRLPGQLALPRNDKVGEDDEGVEGVEEAEQAEEGAEAVVEDEDGGEDVDEVVQEAEEREDSAEEAEEGDEDDDAQEAEDTAQTSRTPRNRAEVVIIRRTPQSQTPGRGKPNGTHASTPGPVKRSSTRAKAAPTNSHLKRAAPAQATPLSPVARRSGRTSTTAAPVKRERPSAKDADADAPTAKRARRSEAASKPAATVGGADAGLRRSRRSLA